MAATATAYTPPITTDDPWALTKDSFGPYAAAGIANGSYPLITLMEETDVEAILVSNQVVGTAGTIQFFQAPSGTLLGSGSALTVAQDLTTGNLPAATTRVLPITGNNTRLPAGTTIGFVSAATPASVAGLIITLITRKGGYRVTDSGGKFYPQANNQT